MRVFFLRIALKCVRYLNKDKINLKEKESLILSDVFGLNFKERVLLSYIKQPFIEGIKYHHTNYLECYTAAEIFNELGFAVDVVDLFDNNSQIRYDEYKIIYGLGIPLENAFYDINSESVLKILYATGCNPFYSYKTSMEQVQNFYLSKGKLMPRSSRVTENFWTCSYFLSDKIIALGNKFVADTFINVNPLINCESVNAFYFDVYDINIDAKNFDISKKHFLWFGSSGLLHKGLDLLIDIFLERKDITLHICGASKDEIKFWDYYQSKIVNCKNIIDYGFVDIKSDKFKNLMNECAFCVYPTASEGGSPALLNVMANGGLIPIASKACGIDIEDFGFEFNELNRVEIEKYIDKVISLSSNELLQKSKYVKQFVKENFTFLNYKKNLKSSIVKAISSKNRC